MTGGEKTRRARERHQDAFIASLLLRSIGIAVRNAGLRGDDAVSAGMGLAEESPQLQRLMGGTVRRVRYVRRRRGP